MHLVRLFIHSVIYLCSAHSFSHSLRCLHANTPPFRLFWLRMNPWQQVSRLQTSWQKRWASERDVRLEENTWVLNTPETAFIILIFTKLCCCCRDENSAPETHTRTAEHTHVSVILLSFIWLPWLPYLSSWWPVDLKLRPSLLESSSANQRAQPEDYPETLWSEEVKIKV